jgi:hypothetical protein
LAFQYTDIRCFYEVGWKIPGCGRIGAGFAFGACHDLYPPGSGWRLAVEETITVAEYMKRYAGDDEKRSELAGVRVGNLPVYSVQVDLGGRHFIRLLDGKTYRVSDTFPVTIRKLEV